MLSYHLTVLGLVYILWPCEAQFVFPEGREVNTRRDCTSMEKPLPVLLKNPPPDFHMECIERHQIEEFINNREYVKGVVDCMKDEPCSNLNTYQPGYERLADAIFFTVGPGATCMAGRCSRRLRQNVRYTIQLMSRRHNDLLQEGITYLG